MSGQGSSQQPTADQQPQGTQAPNNAVRSSGGSDAQQVGVGGVQRTTAGQDPQQVQQQGAQQPLRDAAGNVVTDPAKAAPATGDQQQQQPTPQDQQQQQPTAKTPEQEANERLLADPRVGKYVKTFQEKGDLTDAEVTEAATALNLPVEMVKAYVGNAKTVNASAAQQQEQATLRANAEANAKVAYEFSGNHEGWQNFAAWAQQNMSDQERTSVENAVINAHKDPVTARTVIGSYYSKFQQSTGTGARDVTQQGTGAGGLGGSSNAAGFSSQHEMVAAMQDQRYGRDVEYTRSVETKVKNSTFR